MIFAHGEPGICRFCGCGGDSCRLPDGDLCSWLTRTRDTCTNEPCVRELNRIQKQARIERAAWRKQRKLELDKIHGYHKKSRARGRKKAA